VAIVKAAYTTKREAAKASVRYIAHRPGRDSARITRTLFGTDGPMSRQQAYTVIDAARQGSVFFRFIISPDPAREDTNKDLLLRGITEHTMQTLAERLHNQVSWVGAVHADHTPHRHVHVVAAVAGRLSREDLQALTHAATAASLDQRAALDLAHEALKRQKAHEAEEEAQWDR
jgi:hypothetical protein